MLIAKNPLLIICLFINFFFRFIVVITLISLQLVLSFNNFFLVPPISYLKKNIMNKQKKKNYLYFSLNYSIFILILFPLIFFINIFIFIISFE